MKHFFIIVCFTLLLPKVCLPSDSTIEDMSLMAGDIVFIESNSSQSKALKEATGSKWTHVGILFKEQGQWVVYEATQPVKVTPFKEFIGPSRTINKIWALRRPRLQGRGLNPAQVGQLKAACSKYLGRPYDPYFLWNSKQMYCSEFVYKCFEEGLKVRLSPFQKLGDMNQNSKSVQKMINSRWLKGIKDIKQREAKLRQVEAEKVITPVQLFKSTLLQCVEVQGADPCSPR